MNRTKQAFLLCAMMIPILLGGCMSMSGADNNETTENDNQQDEYEQENYVSIQDYTGEGYTLRDSQEETGQIAEQNRETVIEAVEQYFIKEYHTEITVHNMVSAADGVSVFVESINEPHFFTFAIVPVDIENEIIKTDQIWTQEGQVEKGIRGGLYAMAFEDEFSNLKQNLEELTEKYPIVGTPKEAIENVMGTGYTTPYFFVSPAGDFFDELYTLYSENPDISAEEITKFFNENDFNSGNVYFAIEFYMNEADVEPNEDIYDQIVSDIEAMEGIPSGDYSVVLHDNFIDRKRGIGSKENSIDKTLSEGIIKE